MNQQFIPFKSRVAVFQFIKNSLSCRHVPESGVNSALDSAYSSPGTWTEVGGPVFAVRFFKRRGVRREHWEVRITH